MAEIHTNGIAPTRGKKRIRHETRAISPNKNYAVYSSDLQDGDTLTISLPAGTVTEWISVTYIGPNPTDYDTDLLLYINGDDTSDASKGFPILHHDDAGSYLADGDDQAQDTAPIHINVRTTQLTFKAGIDDIKFSVHVSLIEEKHIGRNSRKWLSP